VSTIRQKGDPRRYWVRDEKCIGAGLFQRRGAIGAIPRASLPRRLAKGNRGRLRSRFVFNNITIPLAFKATCSRRARLWNRQASIIMDLTTLALHHGWHSLPRV